MSKKLKLILVEDHNENRKYEIVEWIKKHCEIFFDESIVIYHNDEDFILQALESFIKRYKEEK